VNERLGAMPTSYMGREHKVTASEEELVGTGIDRDVDQRDVRDWVIA
jgi:hypothetical protein